MRTDAPCHSINKLQLHKRRVQDLRFRAAQSGVAIGTVDVPESSARHERRKARLHDPVLTQERTKQRADAIVQPNRLANVRLKQQLRQRLGVMKMRIVQIEDRSQL